MSIWETLFVAFLMLGQHENFSTKRNDELLERNKDEERGIISNTGDGTKTSAEHMNTKLPQKKIEEEGSFSNPFNYASYLPGGGPCPLRNCHKERPTGSKSVI